TEQESSDFRSPKTPIPGIEKRIGVAGLFLRMRQRGQTPNRKALSPRFQSRDARSSFSPLSATAEATRGGTQAIPRSPADAIQHSRTRCTRRTAGDARP